MVSSPANSVSVVVKVAPRCSLCFAPFLPGIFLGGLVATTRRRLPQTVGVEAGLLNTRKAAQAAAHHEIAGLLTQCEMRCNLATKLRHAGTMPCPGPPVPRLFLKKKRAHEDAFLRPVAASCRLPGAMLPAGNCGPSPGRLSQARLAAPARRRGPAHDGHAAGDPVRVDRPPASRSHVALKAHPSPATHREPA